jgi:hypothetical protein
VLNSGLADWELFSAGYELACQRFGSSGMPAMLPLSRVWVGIGSDAAPSSPGAFGGFHHPGQGYRHLQMVATVTAYGDLLAAVPASPQAVTLDLIRSYSHDCLHYGTFRCYRAGPAGQVVRVQYGINFRHPDGRTYSVPDPAVAVSTRNLGIVMEGATDIEATTIARCAAKKAGLDDLQDPPGIGPRAFADTTGTLTSAAIEQACRAPHPYLNALGGFARFVTSRYRSLLAELGDEDGEPHQRVIDAMISGDLAKLEAWLDRHHGKGCFAALFQAAGWYPLPACA